MISLVQACDREGIAR